MFSGAWCGGMGAGGWLFMVAFWAAFLGLVVWAVMQIFPRAGNSGAAGADPVTPAEVLDRRLAAGEIDVETHRRLQHELHADLR